MSLTESRFHMWRAVTAMVHADAVVRPHEINFIVQNTKGLGMTDAQQAVLTEDLRQPVDMVACYQKITAPKDKEDFFHLAHAMAWSDGELDEREEALLDRVRSLAKGNDRKLLEKARSNFKDIYIDSGQEPGDTEPSVFAFIKSLMRARSA